MSYTKSKQELDAAWVKYKRPRDGQLFQHYKGGRFEIVATGLIENTETPCVVYRSLAKNIIWVRTAKNFLEEVEHDGVSVPRFKPID